ncbi:hypothetical protein BBW65_02245 [Helicobacter enhydrae]|uniref:Guanidinium exporter n=1 Tax=Helicobacter enhydrae TaxID=222136 RepID=A0A1B1U4L5_9HELI|nr:SMR family transporter [Helicobacter enhydrae]ANV97696.1 hypothetical protein BBW65_02245 [Helicobacter enhydrae]
MLWILIGAISEVVWALGLKYSTGNVWEILGIGVALGISAFCLVQACKKMEASVVYAVFVGLGSAFLTTIDMFINSLNLSKLVLIVVLLCGVMGIKFLDKGVAK